MPAFLQLLSITIFSIGINSLVSRIFIATQAVKKAFFYQLALNGLLIIAIWLFTKFYGAYGYPYAIILMNCVNFIAMYLICKRIAPQIDYAALLKYAGLLLLINAVIGAGLYFAQNLLHAGVFGNCIIPFLAYLFNIYGIKILGASMAGFYIYTQPVFAALIATIFLKEELSIYKIVAAALIFTGVYLANRPVKNA